MRTKLDLNLKSLDRLSVLVYGAYGAGKTHFLGDFLRWASVERKQPVAFINIAGEDGWLSIADMGLGEIGETVDTEADFEAAVDECRKRGVYALAVDGLSAYSNLLFRGFFRGELRFPDPTIDGERARMLWGQHRMKMMAAVLRTRNAAPYVIWVAPYDRTEEDPGGMARKRVVPDLVGKQALAAAGWFDFVAQIRAQTLGPNSVRRWLHVLPDEAILTRQRLPNPILRDINIPAEEGGWKVFYEAVVGAFGGNGTVAEAPMIVPTTPVSRPKPLLRKVGPLNTNQVEG